MNKHLRFVAEEVMKQTDADTFQEHMDSMTCSGEIYEEQYGQLLDIAQESPLSPEDIDDIIVPIVQELLVYSANYPDHAKTHRRLLQDIKDAHSRMRLWYLDDFQQHGLIRQNVD